MRHNFFYYITIIAILTQCSYVKKQKLPVDCKVILEENSINLGNSKASIVRLSNIGNIDKWNENLYCEGINVDTINFIWKPIDSMDSIDKTMFDYVVSKLKIKLLDLSINDLNVKNANIMFSGCFSYIKEPNGKWAKSYDTFNIIDLNKNILIRFEYYN